MDVKDLLPVIEEVKSLATTRLDDIETRTTEMQTIISALAQKSVRGIDRLDQPIDTKAAIIDAVKASPDWGRLQKGEVKQTRIQLPAGALQYKAVTATSATIAAPYSVPGGIIAPAQRRHFLRELLTTIPLEQGVVQYLRESAFTNAAAVVPENTLKPQSDITVDLVNANVATIAHWIRVTKQILDDFKLLQGYFGGRLEYGLAVQEDYQILNGTGVGGSFQGLLPLATAFTPAVVTGDTRLDHLRRAIGALAVGEFNADAIVLNTLDWQEIELVKDNESRYIFSQPGDPAGPTIWNVPVVATNAIAQGTYLVGDLNMAARIYDRQQPTIEISTEDQDNFVRNLVTIRGEERLALAVYLPAALLKGTFT